MGKLVLARHRVNVPKKMQLNWLHSAFSIVTHSHDMRFFHHVSCIISFHKVFDCMQLKVNDIMWKHTHAWGRFSSANLFITVCCLKLLCYLGDRQSASDANKLITWMMSIRDTIFVTFSMNVLHNFGKTFVRFEQIDKFFEIKFCFLTKF